MRYGAAYRK
jgi:hypothetical protein